MTILVATGQSDEELAQSINLLGLHGVTGVGAALSGTRLALSGTWLVSSGIRLVLSGMVFGVCWDVCINILQEIQDIIKNK